MWSIYGPHRRFLIGSSSYCANAGFFFLQIQPNLTLCVNILIRYKHTKKTLLFTNPDCVSAPSVWGYFLILSNLSVFPFPALKTIPALLTGNVLQGLRNVPPSVPDLRTAKSWRLSSPARHTGQESVLRRWMCRILASARISRPSLNQ